MNRTNRPTYRLANNVTYTPLDEGQAVLLHTPSRRYYSVNETGKLILDRLQASATPGQMADSLSERYEISDTEALKHVRRLLGELEEEGLIESIDRSDDAS